MNENDIKRSVIAHLKARSSPGVFAFHVPNGDYRKPVEAAILKGLGVVSGTPDIFAIMGGHCFALELKTETGKLSDNQHAVLARLKDCGATCAVAFGLDEALRHLEDWGVLKGKAA